jgi:VWFA-related protein
MRGCFLLALLSWLSLQSAQVPELSLKIDVTLVLFDAVVRNAAGEIRSDLRAEDFILEDRGVRQRISHFSQDLVPLAVALVVDRSASVVDYLPSLRSAALSALGHLKPEDQVVLFSFGECPDRLSDLTQDRARIARQIGAISGGGSTNIFGAIYSAARFLRDSVPERRKAIILISDNYPNVFHIHAADALREALSANATLYGIRTPGSNDADKYQRSRAESDPESVSRIARQTGGSVLELKSLRQVAEALDAIVRNLKSGYTLGFTPADLGATGTYHPVAITLDPGGRCSDCTLQARSGYYVGAGRHPRPEYAPTSELYDCEESLAYGVIRAMNARSADLREIPLQVTGLETVKGGGRTYRVELAIGGKQVAFQEENGRHAGRLLIAVFCRDARGRNLSEDWKRLDMALLDETYSRARESGIPYSTKLPVPEGGREVQVIVYDLGSRRMASRTLRIRSLHEKEFQP